MNDPKTTPRPAAPSAPAPADASRAATTNAIGQKVSQERGSATHKKNPGKRPKQGG